MLVPPSLLPYLPYLSYLLPLPLGARVLCLVARALPSVSTEGGVLWCGGLFSSKISCAGEVKAGWVGAFIGVDT